MPDTVADGLTLNPSGASTPGNQAKQSKVIVPEIKVVEKTQMLEVNPGIWDGLTPDQAKKYYPEDWERFTKDPYSYRVPRAESYHDLSGMYLLHHIAISNFEYDILQFDSNQSSSNSNAKAKIYSSSVTHRLSVASSHTSSVSQQQKSQQSKSLVGTYSKSYQRRMVYTVKHSTFGMDLDERVKMVEMVSNWGRIRIIFMRIMQRIRRERGLVLLMVECLEMGLRGRYIIWEDNELL